MAHGNVVFINDLGPSSCDSCRDPRPVWIQIFGSAKSKYSVVDILQESATVRAVFNKTCQSTDMSLADIEPVDQRYNISK